MKNCSLIYPLRSFVHIPEGPKMIKGEGVFLYDTEGNQYIDAISGLWNIPLGYNNKDINKAITQQLNQLPFVNSITEQSTVLEAYAESLVGILPKSHNKVLYTCSGSESVEVAVKIVRKYNIIRNRADKKEIFSLKMSYHGTSYMAMALSEMDKQESHHYISTRAGINHLEAPYCKCCRQQKMKEECKEHILHSLEEEFKEKGNKVAAVILEPIIGSGGIIPVPQWYLSKLKDLCKEYDCLIIFDEVATGFGRTGTMFAYEQMDIVPDLICMAKAINNGYVPFGAVSIGEKICEEYAKTNQSVEHFSTQNGNLLACASAKATLEILTHATLIEEVRIKGESFKKELEEKLLKVPGVADIRGNGLMIGIDLKDKFNRNIPPEKLLELSMELREKGLLVYMFYIEDVISGISLFPQYITSPESLHSIARILSKTISKKMKYEY